MMQTALDRWSIRLNNIRSGCAEPLRPRALAAPELEIHQRPELLLTVLFAVEVLAHNLFDAGGIEIPAASCLRPKEEGPDHGLQRCPEPLADGNGKTPPP